LPNTATITLEAPGVLDVSASGTLSLADSTAQTLQGNGTLNGSLSAGSSATILPGGANAIGTLTITNAASLAGTIRMELNGTNAVGGTNDQIAAASITYGGDLIVTNLGPALHTGDKFKLFSVAGTGSFNSITLPVSDHGYNYTWTTNLAVDGTIQVLAGAPNVITDPPPHLTNSFNATSGQLTLNWGAGYQGYRLQAQTNTLSTGLTTNWVDWAGSTNVTQEVIALDPTKGTVFFRLIYP
jgi:hypothetical protein